MSTDIKILRKPGWMINLDDNKVNEILKGLIENDGHCPSHPHNRVGHDQCPCSAYIQCDICYCGLYVKDAATTSKANETANDIPFYGGC